MKRSEYEMQACKGFDIICEWIAEAMNWTMFIVFLPISYPMYLLGRRAERRSDTHYRDTYGR